MDGLAKNLTDMITTGPRCDYDVLRHLFTGKERDGEMGLDYFGARYFSGAQGRFTGPDPINANLVRVLNPQRWNMYAYAVNNPHFYKDPDGRDAIAVGFKTLAAGAGHAAVISVHRDGSATFGSYGPRGGSKPVWAGAYDVRPLQTKVTFGSDGTPLTGWFSVLASEVADIEGVDPSSVDMAYFKTSDAETLTLDNYLEELKRRSGGLYVVGVHDCIEICNIALSRIGIGRGSEVADVPRAIIWALSFSADSTYSGATGAKKQKDKNSTKPDVNSTIAFCNEDGSNCKQ